MQGEEAPISSGGARGVRCIVVAAPSMPLPQPLLDGLRRRGVVVHVARDAAEALRSLHQVGGDVMVLVEPGSLPDPNALATSARASRPGLQVWRYAEDQDESLRPYDTGPEQQSTPHSAGPLAPEALPAWHEKVPISVDEMSILLGEAGAEAPRDAGPDDADIAGLLAGDAKKGEVLDTALAVLRRRMGVRDLTLAGPSKNGKPLRGEEVSYQGRFFGRLQSETADREALRAAAQWLGCWLALERKVGDLIDLAHRDELTGAWNRRYFDRALRMILDEADRQQLRVTLMFYDIDDFKGYNDRFGHPAGDEVLIETAKLMSSVVRRQDVVARIGGDEFAVIFWDAEPRRRPRSDHPRCVRAAAERFQRAVYDHHFPKLGREAPGPLTISAGLAGYPLDGDTPEALIAHADRMLQKSKEQGKNALTFGAGTETRPESDADARAFTGTRGS